ncbi:hypothetical protein NQ317_015134 [Molorchus minor]|uniref:Protein NATD1 n=1 Tax=Molorchus minor TaxID=1323400 RepID=A0ABQ9K4W3_9CUCU|nr:hypothetical protein NQ317_015134 [Molorchus minor]
MSSTVRSCSLPSQSRRFDDERNATVDFKKIDENTYDLVHSYIPDEYQGMGLGHVLAESFCSEFSMI